MISTKRLSLTKFRLANYKRTESQGELAKRIKDFDLVNRFNSCGLGKKIKKQNRRRELTDFERFKVMVLRRNLSKLVRTNINQKKKTLMTQAN